MRRLLALLLTLTALPAAAAHECQAPQEYASLGARLPRYAAALATGRETTIVALGSSSTLGIGASSPRRAYPARLAVEMRRQHGLAVRVLNKGVGGEVAGDMLRRLDRDALAQKPDLVIWQLGSNSALRDADPGEHERVLRAGLARLLQTGADVVLMSPQFAPRIIEAPHHRDYILQLERLATEFGVGLFQRFEIMRSWHDSGIGFDIMLSADRLHMNDWSYGCVARLLADPIAARLKQ